jgi:hypothetical protein
VQREVRGWRICILATGRCNRERARTVHDAHQIDVNDSRKVGGFLRATIDNFGHPEHAIGSSYARIGDLYPQNESLSKFSEIKVVAYHEINRLELLHNALEEGELLFPHGNVTFVRKDLAKPRVQVLNATDVTQCSLTFQER